MPNFAICRVAAVKSGKLAGLARHHTREHQPANADPNAPKPSMPRPSTAGEVVGRVKAAVEAHNASGRKLQSNSPVALDLFVGMSKSQGQAKDDEYFRRSLDWIEQRYGKENVLLAAVHRDETTPHMQVLVMPRIDGRFQASKVLGNRDDFRKMQDSFYEAAGAPLGLDRGLRHSQAKHVSIKQFYGALAAGQKIPEPVPVPASPGMLDRVLHPAQSKELAERRAKAIEHNKRRAKLIGEAARAAGKVHPEIVRRNAEAYRLAKSENDAAQRAKDMAAKAQHNANLLARNPATIVAKALRLLPQDAVNKLARHLGPGVELQAGKDLIDQLRRQGKCSDLADGLARIETALANAESRGESVQDIREAVSHAPRP